MSPVRKGDKDLLHYWIVQRLHERGRTRKQLADHLDLPASRITEILKGEREVKRTELKPLASFLNLPESVVNERLNRGKFQVKSPGIQENINPRLVTRPIRVIGQVQAGLFQESIEWPPEEQFEVQMHIKPIYDGAAVFGLEVVGPSMNLKYPEGTIVICVSIFDLGPGYVLEPNKFYLVYRRNQRGETEATVKQLRIDPDGKHWLWPMSDHPDYQQPWLIDDLSSGSGFLDDDQDISIGAKVISAQRDED